MKTNWLLCGVLALVLVLLFSPFALAAKNWALQFDAGKDTGDTGTKVTADHSKSLNLDAQITIEAWIFPTALEAAGRRSMITGKADAWMHAVFNEASVYQGAVNAAQWAWEGSGKLGINKWVHVATSFNGRAYNLYINGKRKDTVQDPGAINTSLSDVYVGWFPQWNEAFSGMIDEVRISAIGRYPAGDFEVPDTEFESDGETVLLYHFNEGEGKATEDSSLFGNTGFIDGARWVESTAPVKPLVVDRTDDKLSTTWGRIKKTY